jgi:hypothetical protein
MLRVTAVRIVAITLIVGGVIRVAASRALFEAFGIGAVWPEAPYSLYSYRVLGGFVLLPGILLMLIAQEPARYRIVLRAYAGGLALIGLIMLVAGLTVGLSYRYYLPDPVYCFAVGAILWQLSRCS